MMKYFLLLIMIDIGYSCGTCYGDLNSAAVEGMNWAIIFLLGTTGSVLSGVVLSIISIGRKSKNK